MRAAIKGVYHERCVVALIIIIIIIIIIINLLSAISQWFNGALQFKLKKIKDKTKT